MSDVNFPKVCNAGEVEDLVTDFYCQCGFLGGVSAEDFMHMYASFEEFLQDEYPDCILTPEIVMEWINQRRKVGVPLITERSMR